jgi:hypothetical protein
MQMNPRLKATLLSGSALLFAASVVQAQMGSGWTQQSYTERLEYHHTGGDDLDTISPAPSSGFADSWIAYTNKNSTRYFWFKNTDAGRVEIRVNNDYTSGTHQFEGYLTFFQPSGSVSGYSSTTCSQDFGAATHAAWKLEMFTDNGGDLEGEEASIMTGVYGQTHRINIIHDMNVARIYVFVDGSMLYNQPDQGGTNHYTKFGMYQGGTVVHDQWSNPKYFTGGSVSGGGGIDTSAEYQLQNEASSLVLNNQGRLTNGSAITQYSSVSSDNLRWTFIPTDSGYYQINSVKSGLDAVVQGASTASGAGIIQWSFGSAQNDQWLPQLNSDGSYTFVNRHSGLVLEDPGSSTSTSTQMDQWGTNGGSNQKWTLIKQ